MALAAAAQRGAQRRSVSMSVPFAYLGVYLASLLVFLLVDAVWLTLVMRPLFERHIGDMLRESILLAPAAGFYLIYVAGVVYLCVEPGLREGSVWPALGHGLLLGFLAYGTYEFTNMSTLRGWAWPMLITDTAWGMALTGGTAVAGLLVARALGLGAQ